VQRAPQWPQPPWDSPQSESTRRLRHTPQRRPKTPFLASCAVCTAPRSQRCRGPSPSAGFTTRCCAPAAPLLAPQPAAPLRRLHHTLQRSAAAATMGEPAGHRYVDANGSNCAARRRRRPPARPPASQPVSRVEKWVSSLSAAPDALHRICSCRLEGAAGVHWGLSEQCALMHNQRDKWVAVGSNMMRAPPGRTLCGAQKVRPEVQGCRRGN
jgi:hypothetical protein